MIRNSFTNQYESMVNLFWARIYGKSHDSQFDSLFMIHTILETIVSDKSNPFFYFFTENDIIQLLRVFSMKITNSYV